MNVSMNNNPMPVAVAVARSAPPQSTERAEVAENDGDSDDGAAKAAAKPSLNVNGQALGQLLNAVA